MISAGSSELTQKWVDVLHNDSDDYIIPESNINVMCPYNCLDMSGNMYSVNNSTTYTYCTPRAIINSPKTINRNRKIATFEWNFWVLDGSFEVLDDDEKFNGFMSIGMSGENCAFSGSTTAYINRTDGGTFPLNKNQTLKFNPMASECPAIFNIVSRYTNAQDETVVVNNIDFDIESMLEEDNINEQEYVDLYSDDIDTTNSNTQLIMTFSKTLMPYRRIRISEYNNGYKFFLDKYDMQNFTHTRNVNLKMEELPQNDVSVTFADLEGIFDGRNTSAPFHISFNNNHRFYIYYGYNFDDIGWNYVQIDFLGKNNLQVDRDSLETTLNLQSTMQVQTQKYNTNNLELDPTQDPQPAPYHWQTFSGFCYAITETLKSAYPNDAITSVTYDSNITGYFTTSYTKWQFMIAQACCYDKTFPNTKMSELLQQISALMRCAIVRKPDGNIHFRTLDNPSTTEVDYVPLDNIITFPSYEKEADIKTFYISSPASCNGQDEDKNTPVYASGTQIATAPPLRKKITISGASGNDEQTLQQNIVPIRWENYDSWNWTTNMWTAYAENYRKWHIPTRYTFEELFINPLWQVCDTLKLYTGDIKNYLGLIEKIEVQYDGSFKGSVTICSLEN